MTMPQPAYISELLRHFADLRDGTHGDASSRRDKEHLFTQAVSLLDPYARQALNEINERLLLGTGEVTATGVRSFGRCWGPLRLDTLLAGATATLIDPGVSQTFGPTVFTDSDLPPPKGGEHSPSKGGQIIPPFCPIGFSPVKP
jgi:hypothetical protein